MDELDKSYYELAGLIGFVFAGLIFLAAGVINGDAIRIVGSTVWVISCLILTIPHLKSRK